MNLEAGRCSGLSSFLGLVDKSWSGMCSLPVIGERLVNAEIVCLEKAGEDPSQGLTPSVIV